MTSSNRLRRDLAITFLAGLCAGFGWAVAFYRHGIL